MNDKQVKITVKGNQVTINLENLFVRPTYRKYGVYETIGVNRARLLYEGTFAECKDFIRLMRS